MIANEIPQLNEVRKIRFIQFIKFSTKCWEWKGSARTTGYGEFYIKDKGYLAHRVAYELFTNTKIPLDMTIDHLCHNKKCVNPSHLEVVTSGENISRLHSRKTHCPKGHPYSGKNLRTAIKNGSICRYCRECKKEINKRRRKNFISTVCLN